MRHTTVAVLLWVAILTLAACNPDPAVDPLCQGIAQPCQVFHAGEDAGVIASAFVQVKENTTLVFEEGTFAFASTLDLGEVSGVTVRGAGIDRTILDFAQQQAGAGVDGIFANQSRNVTFQEFTVRNAAGNGIRVTQGDGVYFRKLKVTWTSGHPSAQGAYGLYPVLSRNVLIEDSILEAAADSGICASQADHAILRRNQLTGNVAGIIVRNGYNVDIHDNTATGNAAGIVVPSLPGDEQLNGRRIRIFDNTITDNNRINDADPTATVRLIPSGTGLLVLGNREVEIFGNTISDNHTSGLAVVSYLLTGQPLPDPGLYPFPGLVAVHDNVIRSNGAQPDQTNAVGFLLYSGTPAYVPVTGGSVPDILYDGVVDPLVAGPDGNPMRICLQANGSATFGDLHVDQLSADGTNLAEIVTFDTHPYDCTLPALDAVVVPGA